MAGISPAEPSKRAPDRAEQFTARSQWFDPQAQDLVLTLLGTYVHPRDWLVWSGGLVALLADFGFEPGTSRVALARLARRDLLEPIKEGRRVHYRITPRLVALLDEGDERIFSLGRRRRRDGRWTVVWHAIPESKRVERTRLARRLRFLGFGSLQWGTWIAPAHREAEVVRLIRDLGVEGETGVLLGHSPASFSFTDFAARAWDLEELAERYASYEQEFAAWAPARARRDLGEREAFLLRTRLAHMFRQFPFVDPDLPDEAMPQRRARARAIALFDKLYAALESPSQAYFNAAMRPAGVGGG